MSLSKPDAPTYSSFDVLRRSYFEAVLLNYPHHQYVTDMVFYHLRYRKILTPELMKMIAGNYSPETYRRIDLEIVAEKSPSRNTIYFNFNQICGSLDDLLRTQGIKKDYKSDLTPEEKAEVERLMQAIPDYIEKTVMPMLLRMDRYNRELYEPFRFENFTASLASCAAFSDLAQLFIPNFFLFTCYSDRTQRIKVLELAVKKGMELLPSLPTTMFRQDMPGDEHCHCCLWLFLQYYDLAKRSPFNLCFKTGRTIKMVYDAVDALILHIDEMQTRLLKPLCKKRLPPMPKLFYTNRRRLANRYSSITDRSAPKPPNALDITVDMLHRQPLLSYTLYALDYLSLDDLTLNLERARTNDILVHMAPLFSLEYECAIAFASGRHLRLGGTREVTKMERVPDQEGAPKRKRPLYKPVVLSVGSPLLQLDDGILQAIWELTERHFQRNSGLVPRLKPYVGARSMGRRELLALRK